MKFCFMQAFYDLLTYIDVITLSILIISYKITTNSLYHMSDTL